MDSKDRKNEHTTKRVGRSNGRANFVAKVPSGNDANIRKLLEDGGNGKVTDEAVALSASALALADKKLAERGIHKGHRQRMRESAARDAELVGFSDVELIELLLSFFVPQRDTNVYAHRMLDRFGSVLGLLNASEDELAQFTFLPRKVCKILPQMAYVCAASGVLDIALSSRSRAVDFFGAVYAGGYGYGTVVAYLNENFKPISVERYRDNGFTGRSIISGVCKYGAKYVFMARRDEEVFPDAFDLRSVMRVLADIISAVGSQLLDFMMFTDYGYYSLGTPPRVGSEYPMFVFTPYRKGGVGEVRRYIVPGGDRVRDEYLNITENTEVLNGLKEILIYLYSENK